MLSDHAWEAFLTRGQGGLARQEIEASWNRSRESGVDPERLELAPVDYDPDALLIRLGSHVIRESAPFLVGDNASVAVIDDRGIVGWQWVSDPSLRRDLSRAQVEEGRQFVEDRAGTNGVGLSMAVRRAAIVVGPEHYKQAWHAYTCATGPIVDPVSRRYLGSLNVCCRAEDTNRYVMAAVVAFAERLRHALRDAATPRQRRLLDAHMRCRADRHRWVVTLDADVMISDDGTIPGLPDRETLWQALLESGPTTSTLSLPDGRIAEVRPVTRGRLDDGCVLLFDRVGSRVSTSNPLERAEADVIRDALRECAGNKSAAARLLGVSRVTLYRRIRRYGLDQDSANSVKSTGSMPRSAQNS